jgi:hypothetical protein
VLRHGFKKWRKSQLKLLRWLPNRAGCPMRRVLCEA